MNKSRRHLLKATGAAAVALPILHGQQHSHQAADTPASPAYKAKWATSLDMKLIGELADLIIPRTDTPGASDAKVQEYIDSVLASDKKRRDGFKQGLAAFAPLDSKGRAARLKTISTAKPETPDGRFFTALKDLTIDGYYQSREGLTQELGWHGNTYLAEFKGCTHKEHQS